MALGDWVDRFAVWEGFHPDLQTLLIYALGIAVYAALVFTFYHNIARRDPLHSAAKKGWWGKLLHHGETALTFPLLSFGYFAVLALSLFVLAKPSTATAHILLLSMAAVLGVRVTAYVSEAMAEDIAKLVPLSLLAVVLVDPGYLSLGSTFARIGESVTMAPVLAQYFVLFILVEAVLRGIHMIFPGVRSAFDKVEHRRRVSKRAMLKSIEHDHGGRHMSSFHDHKPRAEKFVTLDEHSAGKPGSRQGAGPAMRERASAAKHTHGPAPARRPPSPRAGPGA